jgi:fimbrial chaperone protein
VRTLVAALLAAVTAAPLAARGVTMEVAPVIIDLGRAAPSAIVTIRNSGTAPTRYQLSAASWTEARTGQPELEPSQELSIFPPLFQLGPGEERKVRVGAVVPPGATERAWRLFIEELPPPATTSPAGASIRIRTRFALAVFLAPALPRRSAALSLARAGGGVSLTLRNTGNVRIKPGALAVAFLGAARERLHAVELPPASVLAEAEQRVEVQAPAALCAKVRTAALTAEIEGEKRTEELALPDGACAP